MPNDLYDLEIAPKELNKDEVIAPLLNETSNIMEQIADLEKVQTKKSQDELNKLRSRKIVLDQEKIELEKIIDELYDQGNLKDKYIERIQQNELQSMFSNPYLKPFVSHRVALRSETKEKVLDYLRDVEWE